MQNQHSKSQTARFTQGLVAVLFFTVIIAVLYFGLLSMTDGDLLGHSCYDSYTRQALAWRQGYVYLPDGENLTWLELAIYEGKYFVSFPPVPSLVMLPLTYHYDIETPHHLVCWVYGYLTFLMAYFIFSRRCQVAPWMSAFYAFCFYFGCNVFALSFSGWVWYQAQTLGFFLTTAAVYCIMGDRKYEHGVAYFLWALSVGCRPFHALFFPYLLYRTYKLLNSEDNHSAKKLVPKILLIMAPAVVVGATMMIYNYVRFDSFFEFGHSYLPAHTRGDGGQFSLEYMAVNTRNALRLPWVQDGLLQFHSLEGNNFYISNPIYIVMLIAMVKYRKKKEAWLLFGLVLLNAILLLTHKCMGALQFGLRYFVDMIPWMLALLLIDREVKERWYISLLGIYGVAINIYGAWWFWVYTQSS